MRMMGPDLLALRQAHAIAPDLLLAKLSLSFALLMHQQFEEGWALYESRLEQNRAITLPIGLEKWDGITELDELLIVAEQGAGDLVQFMRYSILLRLRIPGSPSSPNRNLGPYWSTTVALMPCVSVKQPYRVMQQSAWYPMASILGLLGINNQAVIIDAPYLAADPEKTKRWADAMIPENGAPLIGLNWQGNPVTEDDFFRGRSFPWKPMPPWPSWRAVNGCRCRRAPVLSNWKPVPSVIASWPLKGKSTRPGILSKLSRSWRFAIW
jgi:hypothetical protein